MISNGSLPAIKRGWKSVRNPGHQWALKWEHHTVDGCEILHHLKRMVETLR